MEIRRLFGAIRRKVWVFILLGIVGAMVSGIFSYFTSKPLYESTATLYILNRTNTLLAGEGISYNDLMLSRQLVKDYGDIAVSRKVLLPVIKELGLATVNEDYLRRVINIGLKDDSNIMTITVVWADPETSAAIANSVSRVFTSKIKELTSNDSVGILDDAKVPTTPVTGQYGRMIVIGLIAGIALAFVIVYVIELFDTTIRSADDIEIGQGLKIIGIIPEYDIR